MRHVGQELRLGFARPLRRYLGADQLGFDMRALGEVARHLGKAEQPAIIVAHGRHYDVRAKLRAVLAHAPGFLLEASSDAGELDLALRLAKSALGRRVEGRHALSNDLVSLVPEDALGTGVPARDATVRVQHEDGVID